MWPGPFRVLENPDPLMAISSLLVFVWIFSLAGSLEASVEEKTIVRAPAKGESLKVAVLVGVNRYPAQGNLPHLSFATEDARQLGGTLDRLGYQVEILLDRHATRQELLRRLSRLAIRFQERDGLLLFFFSGHGFSTSDTQYLALYDTRLGELETTAVSLQDLIQSLTHTGAQRRVLLLDACRNDPDARARATGLMRFKPPQSATPRGLNSKNAPSTNGEGNAIFYSTKDGELSYESLTIQRGIFAHFLQEGLEGGAAIPGDGRITFHSLSTYTIERVRGYSTQGSIQVPYTSGERTGEFVLLGPRRRWHTESAIDMKLRYVPAGTFMMGSPASEEGRHSDEAQHEVKIDRPFWIGTKEITRAQWQRLLKEGESDPSLFKHCLDCPVETVNWFEALKLANRLSKAAGLEQCYSLDQCDGRRLGEDMECTVVEWIDLECPGYRLPTEAEWEYAARAGAQTSPVDGPSLERIGWHLGNSDVSLPGGMPCAYTRGTPSRDDRCGTQQVGGKEANPWGLYDVTGNVWEWTWSAYDRDPMAADKDSRVPDIHHQRVIRGCSWQSQALDCRLARRNQDATGNRAPFIGLRLVRNALR